MNEHMRLSIVRHKSIARAALVTVGVLLIPLWGNFYVDGWNWDWHGLVVAGAFVFSAALTYELVVKGLSNKADRFAMGLAVATAFVFVTLVFWKTNVAPGAAVPVIGLNRVFIVLLAISALLFRRAARPHEMPPIGLE